MPDPQPVVDAAEPSTDAAAPTSTRPAGRAAERAAQHAQISRLADDLLPALIAKLGATGLGELEVREDGWKVRLRGSTAGGAAAPPADARRASRPGRPDAHRGASQARPGHLDADAGNGAVGPAAPAAVGPGQPADPEVARSPAVGYYRPRADLRSGQRIQAGDVLGAVDMLGVPQEVVAPVDGIVGASLADPGEAVEYGQPLLRIAFAPPAGATIDGATEPTAADVAAPAIDGATALDPAAPGGEGA